MHFTPEEREKINRELAKVEEEQRKNKNKTYTFDEVVAEVYTDFGLTVEDFYAQLCNRNNKECSL